MLYLKEDKVLGKYKIYYLYAKQYGDLDIAQTYFNKINDRIAQQVYGEFGYETLSMSEKEEVLETTLKLINNN
jgi:hypothetical protein